MDNYLQLFDLVGELARRRYQVAERHFSTLGLNHTEARLLTLLKAAEGQSSQESLSNSLIVDRTNAGRALKALEARGYISRKKGDVDKRTNIVHITAKGSAAAGEIAVLKTRIVESFFGDLSESDATTILALLGPVLGDPAQ